MQQIKTSKLLTVLIIIIAALVLIIGGVIVYSGDGEAGSSSNNTATSQQGESSEQITNEQTESQDYISYTATTEGSALDQLISINDTVSVGESEYGKTVDAINGLVGGDDGHYWTFYIDGEMAPVGADAFNPEGGELIEWKYQAL